jgi:Tol biopolymer transport system component
MNITHVSLVLIACACLANKTVQAQSSYCSVERVSVATGGTESDGHSRQPAFSSDLRYVAFASEAATLVPGDSNAAQDIFVRDRFSARTEIVSVSSTGELGDSGSVFPSISADGRYVAFVSAASNLVPGDVNGLSDVFVRDRVLGTTTLVSLVPGGIQLNGDIGFTQLSSDGKLIVFETLATNLGFVDSNDDVDIYVHELATGQVELVSIATSGETGTEGGEYPRLSGDGTLVVFDSYSTDLIPGGTAGNHDIYVRDWTAGTTTRVSTSPSGEEANGECFQSSISADGRYVSFETFADNLAPGTSPGVTSIVRKDRVTGATLHVSEGVGGAVPDEASSYAVISQDGRFVAFRSWATNLVVGDTNAAGDVFVRDCTLGTTERVSVTSTGAQASMTYSVSELAIALDGSAVAFGDPVEDLVPGDKNAVEDLFVRDCTRNHSLLCQGKQNSQGCVPVLLASGNTSASSAIPFVITASLLINNKQGLFLYALLPDATPFQAGTLCLQPPIVRLGAQSTGGNAPPDDCSGTLAVDFKVQIQSGTNPALVAGQLVYVQAYYRDGKSPLFASGLSPSVEFEIEP